MTPNPLFRLALLSWAISILGACGHQSQDLIARQAWIRLPPPGAGVAAGYVELSNPGPGPVTLTAVHSERFARAEIHSMSMRDGLAGMRQLESLAIPAATKLALRSGAEHFMLMQARSPLRAGEIVPLTLHYRDTAGLQHTLTVDFAVRAP